MSVFKKGCIPWNKGKKGVYSKKMIDKLSEVHKGKRQSEETKIKRSKSLKGHIVLEETKKKISLAQKGRKSQYVMTDEIRKKMSESRKGKPSLLKGRKIKEETKNKIREWVVNHPNRKFKDTSIELRVENELQRKNINYQKQVPLCNIAIVDFYLPEYRIVIQCDGDYWHSRLIQKERDERQDKVLIFNGFNVYRFWEHEINKDVSKCINKLLKK
jgi:very-short-patch-repair endonuclease